MAESLALAVIPKQAVKVIEDVIGFPVVKVIDDRTNIEAAENLKIVNKSWEDFLEFCEDEKKKLYGPYKAFIDEIKKGEDVIKEWIRQQKATIGSYNLDLMKKENERREEEQKRIDEQRRKDAAEISAPVPAAKPPVMVERTRVKTEFVNSTVKEVPEAEKLNILEFLTALDKEPDGELWQGKIVQINTAQLNAFCRDRKLNGKDKTFPGVQVKMAAQVRAGR